MSKNHTELSLQMSVELRIILKPIIPKLPLIGGIQIFFLNCPDIDFTLEGIANIPGFKHFIKRRVLKIICKKLVFPNGIPLKISKSLDAAELKSVEPEVCFSLIYIWRIWMIHVLGCIEGSCAGSKGFGEEGCKCIVYGKVRSLCCDFCGCTRVQNENYRWLCRSKMGFLV